MKKKICIDPYYPLLFKMKKNIVRTMVPIANNSLWPYKIPARNTQVDWTYHFFTNRGFKLIFFLRALTLRT